MPGYLDPGSLAPRASGMTTSIRGDAARLERRRPLLDLALDEAAEVFGRHAVVGGDLGAHRLQALANRRRLGGADDSGVELLDDRLGRALGQKHRAPGIGFEVLHA